MWLKHYVAKNIKVANILSMIIILSGTPNDEENLSLLYQGYLTYNGFWTELKCREYTTLENFNEPHENKPHNLWTWSSQYNIP